MSTRRYPLSVSLVRHDPPMTNDELAPNGVEPNMRRGLDCGVLVAFELDADMQPSRCDLIPVTGLHSGRHGAWCPGALQQSLLFDAWVLFGKGLLDADALDQTQRDIVGALLQIVGSEQRRAQERHEAIRAAIHGAPAWVFETSDHAIGLDMAGAWSEVLRGDLRERIEEQPLAVRLEWEVFLSSFSMRMRDGLAKHFSARPTRPMVPAAAREVASFIVERILDCIRTGDHPPLRV